MMLLLRLYYEYFKVGLFAVGGGLATLPFLYDMSDKTGWFTHTDLSNLLAISESTPGPIGINAATYVGFLTNSRATGSTLLGVVGSIVATIGLITPSIIVILIVARMLQQFRQSKLVDHVFYGLRPASTGLIAAAAVIVFRAALWNGFEQGVLLCVKWPALVLAIIMYIAIKKTDKHPIFYLGASAIVGMIFHFASL